MGPCFTIVVQSRHLSWQRAYLSFATWLKPKAPCLLTAHNCERFDARHLVKALESTEVCDEFEAVASGFSDTLPAFQELLPDLLQARYEAHNDVQALSKLTSKFLSNQLLANNSFQGRIQVGWIGFRAAHKKKKIIYIYILYI